MTQPSDLPADLLAGLTAEPLFHGAAFVVRTTWYGAHGPVYDVSLERHGCSESLRIEMFAREPVRAARTFAMLSAWADCLRDKSGLCAWPVVAVVGDALVSAPPVGERLDDLLARAARPFARAADRAAALTGCAGAGRWLAAVHGSRPPGAPYPHEQALALLERGLDAMTAERGVSRALAAHLLDRARRLARALEPGELARVASHADFTPARVIVGPAGISAGDPGFSELIPDRMAGCAPLVDLASFRAAVLGASWPGALTAARRAWAAAFQAAYTGAGGRSVSSGATALFELKHLVLMLAGRPGRVARWTGGRSRAWVLERWLGHFG